MIAAAATCCKICFIRHAALYLFFARHHVFLRQWSLMSYGLQRHVAREALIAYVMLHARL